jgi:hypothetical protein
VSKEFKLCLENVLPATPEEIWHAVATGPGNLGWLYPMEIEPWEGGVVSRGPCTVATWDPPRQFACRREDDEGFSMVLTYLVEDGSGDGSTLRTTLHWVQEGDVDGGWDTRTDAATEHAHFFHHTLGQYLRYFNGRAATYVEVGAPASSTSAGAFSVVRRGLGLDGAVQGDVVAFAPPGAPLGAGVADAAVDYLSPHFIGLRTAETLYRFFGRNAWGGRVGMSLHAFGDPVDEGMEGKSWAGWLDDLFSSPSPGEQE